MIFSSDLSGLFRQASRALYFICTTSTYQIGSSIYITEEMAPLKYRLSYLGNLFEKQLVYVCEAA